MYKIAIIQHASDLSGSSLSALDIAKSLRIIGHEAVVVLAEDGAIRNRLLQEGFRVVRSPHKNWLRASCPRALKVICKEISSASRMADLLRLENVDAVYVNSLPSLAGVLASNKLGLPVAWHLREMLVRHGGEMRWPRSDLGVTIVRKIIGKRSNLIVCSSDYAAKGWGISENPKLRKLPNVVSLAINDDFHRRESLRGNSKEKYVIGVPGSLRHIKGQDWFLATIAPWLRTKPGLVEVRLAGEADGAFKKALDEIISSEQVINMVRFDGVVENMRSWYSECDIVCITSISETFGRAAVEPISLEVQTLVHNVAALPEVLPPVLSHMTFDRFSIVDKLELAFRSALVSKQALRSAGALVRQRYSYTNQASKLKEIVNQLVSMSKNERTTHENTAIKKTAE